MLKVIKGLLLFFSLLFIYHFTMTPSATLGIGTETGGINLHPLQIINDYHNASAKYFIINECGNIFLFMPLGFVLPLLSKRLRGFLTVLFIGVCISCLIEYYQLRMPTRWTDIDDVILNATGTAIGCIVFKTLHLLYSLILLVWRSKKTENKEGL